MATATDDKTPVEGPNTALFDLSDVRIKIAEKKQAIHRDETAQRAMKAGLGILLAFWALVAALNMIRPDNTPLLWIDIGVAAASIGFVGYAIYYLVQKNRHVASLHVDISRLRGAEQDAKYRLARHGLDRILWTYHSDTIAVIDDYRSEALRYRRVHNRFQTVIIIGSLMVTAVTTAASQYHSVEWIAVFISFFVGVSAGMTGYFKFRERSMNLQRAADDLDRESKAVELGIFVYRDREEKDRLAEFAERAERIKEDQRNREQQVEQPPDTHSSTGQPARSG